GVRPVAGAAVRRSRAGRRRGLEAVRRAETRRSRAALGDVALTRRGAADGGRRLEDIRWAGFVRPIAALGNVALTGLGTTGVGRRKYLLLAARVYTVAHIVQVAVTASWAAHGPCVTRREDTLS